MNLILFFNGWGMDERVIEDVAIPKNYKLEVINFPYEVNTEFEKYNEIILIGWSFGCYYLTKWLTLNREMLNMSKVKKIVAINGNGEIIGKFGITPKIFEFTLSTLTPDSLLKFYKNMGIKDDFKVPKKEFEKIKYELEYFKNNYEPLKNIFTEAIIGKEDKIVQYARQKKYCEIEKIFYKELEIGHYPFDFIKNWGEII
ncbi:pimeloyl-ACP methyl esterase BioG family protein [uncultured Fusobacterium sp.]|uniref:pimeloyl-ACP methyl esterase BioG family protein n=1 Tax=uncultured Fusobacterium sp. TaxID=159267 RepID=UPI0025F50EF7|nr:pimeloyl-ACP methyl esterase BioG family protein [uncultured Fusobacterium sp.]